MLRLNDVNRGPSRTDMHYNVAKMKQLETTRMENLAKEQPEIFLPSDIDLTMEDIIEEHECDNLSDHLENHDYNIEEDEFRELSCRIRKGGGRKNRKIPINIHDDTSILKC